MNYIICCFLPDGQDCSIKVHTEPSKTSPPLVVLGKADEGIYMGEERKGLYRVTTRKAKGGWTNCWCADRERALAIALKERVMVQAGKSHPGGWNAGQRSNP